MVYGWPPATVFPMSVAPDVMALEASDRPAAHQGHGYGWIEQFAWRNGAIEIRKTGVRLALDWSVAKEVVAWALYLALLGAVVMARRLTRPANGPVIWFAPDRPQPWYLIRGAALWAGLKSARTPAEATAAIYFDDATQGRAPRIPGLTLLNGQCTDISKSRVAEVFEEVFGYPLQVDPGSARGVIVEKAEKNGVHDGRLVRAPLAPRPGYSYQRLIDTSDARGRVQDLRTPCVGGVPVVVWEKTKPEEKRFAIHNSRAALRQPADVFSAEELQLITAFNARMGLDCGGLDILRDRQDGRIYIVDVNKTDLGPVIALSWSDKIRSMNRLSRALAQLVAEIQTRRIAA